jgi:hypothetical protein
MVVRNSWVTQGREAAGFVDAADFEEIKRQGDSAIKRWIDDQLQNTSVTVVLVGAETCLSRRVRYGIERSVVLVKAADMSASSDKHEHLEFLQAAINRMAGNLFLLKGWTITLIAALFALAAKDTTRVAD